MRTWQLQEAASRLSEVVKQAAKEGPQGIAVRGETRAIVVSSADFTRLKQPRQSFTEFMRRSPLHGVELDMKRKQTRTRDADVS